MGIYRETKSVDTIAFRFCWTIIRTVRGFKSDIKCRWMYKKCKNIKIWKSCITRKVGCLWQEKLANFYLNYLLLIFLHKLSDYYPLFSSIYLYILFFPLFQLLPLDDLQEMVIVMKGNEKVCVTSLYFKYKSQSIKHKTRTFLSEDYKSI